MSFKINQVILVDCFLPRDAELKYTGNKNPMATFSIGYDNSYKTNGEFVNRNEYFNCIIYGKLAETAVEFLKKGKIVDVSGKLRATTTEKNGKKYTNNFIEVREYCLKNTQKKNPSTNQSADSSVEYDADVVPF